MAILKFSLINLTVSEKYYILIRWSWLLRREYPPDIDNSHHEKHTFSTVQIHAQALSRVRISVVYCAACKLMVVVSSLHKSDGSYTGTWLPFFPVYFRQHLEF